MATWIINPDGYPPYCSNCGYEPELPKLHSDNRTPYCPNCGEAMKKEFEEFEEIEEKGTCETCEYMHEIERRYDYKKVIIPECWGISEPQAVGYSDTCKYYKRRMD